MPLMQLKMLVLPAPLGPMMAKKSPALTSRLTPARAATPPKLSCRASRASSVIGAGAPKGCPETRSRAFAFLPEGPDGPEPRRRPRACEAGRASLSVAWGRAVTRAIAPEAKLRIAPRCRHAHGGRDEPPRLSHEASGVAWAGHERSAAVQRPPLGHHGDGDARLHPADPGHQRDQRRAPADPGRALGGRRRGVVGPHLLPRRQRHRPARHRLADDAPGPAAVLRPLHGALHRQLVPLRASRRRWSS